MILFDITAIFKKFVYFGQVFCSQVKSLFIDFLVSFFLYKSRSHNDDFEYSIYFMRYGIYALMIEPLYKQSYVLQFTKSVLISNLN